MRSANVRACIRCGSDHLKMPGLREGVVVGEGQDLARWACVQCGLTAIPLLFDSEKARVAYAKEKEKERAKEGEPTGWPPLGGP